MNVREKWCICNQNFESALIGIEDLKASVDNQFGFLESEVELRVESLKARLDCLNVRCRKKLKLLKRKYLMKSKGVVKFAINSNVIEESLVLGVLKHPFQRQLTGKCLHREINLKFDAKNCRMCYLAGKEEVIILNPKECLLYELTLNSGRLSKCLYSKTRDFLKPIAICTDNREHVFICDCMLKKLFCFNLDFTHRWEFQVKNVGKHTYTAVSSDGFIYITNWSKNRVTVFNYLKRELICAFKVKSPAEIVCSGEVLLVNSTDLVTTDLQQKAFKSNERKSSNCIFVINKSDYEIVSEIRVNEWIAPFGLHVDPQQNILTTARSLNPDSSVSSTNCLFLFNSNGDVKEKIDLGVNRVGYDVVFIKNKMFVLQSNGFLKITALQSQI